MASKIQSHLRSNLLLPSGAYAPQLLKTLVLAKMVLMPDVRVNLSDLFLTPQLTHKSHVALYPCQVETTWDMHGHHPDEGVYSTSRRLPVVQGGSDGSSRVAGSHGSSRVALLKICNVRRGMRLSGKLWEDEGSICVSQ